MGLDGLARYAQGWDGREGAAADRRSFALAGAFARLWGDRIPRFDPGINADGTAVLVFEEDGLHARLRFCPDGVVAAYVRRGGTEWDGEVRFDGTVLPLGLTARLAP